MLRQGVQTPLVSTSLPKDDVCLVSRIKQTAGCLVTFPRSKVTSQAPNLRAPDVLG
jgi:hypothetical protein